MRTKIAELYDYQSKLIAHCTNAPDSIAKAAMEHPEVRFYRAWGSGGMRHISAVRPYMDERNQATSAYVAMPGVTPAINSFDPAEFTEN